MSLELDIEKKLGSFHLKMQLCVENEVLSILGASGCGKSMTLKCIAGIEKPDRGRIVLDGLTLFDSEKGINLAPQKRRTGLLFQNYALFPNMTVEQNIRTGTLRDKRKKECSDKVYQALERFKLTEYKDLYPAQLSGGQQQRCALARILISDPDILLLDEPFSALDAHLRFQMEQEVKKIISDFGKTVILVSHDRDEVFRMSDKVAVMNAGCVDAFGTKAEVFADPRTRTACMLTGCKNISPALRLDETHVLATDWNLELKTRALTKDIKYIGIRHHALSFSTEDESAIVCEVLSIMENPFTYTVMLRRQDDEAAGAFGWELSKDEWEKIRGGKIRVKIVPEDILLLEE